jgi:hypothetical protein
MYTCVVCLFSVPFDDAVAPTGSGRCVCLACYLRNTNSYRMMDKRLRRMVELALSEPA